MLGVCPGELVAQTSVRAERGRVQRADRDPALASLAEDRADGPRREAGAATLGQRRHAPDAAHRELTPTEPLTVVAACRRRDHPAVLEGAAELLEGERRRAVLEEGVRQVQRHAHRLRDLLAVILRGCAELGHRTKSQAHGDAPHFGHPCAYRAAAASRSTPERFASDASQARTSENSWSSSSGSPLRRAFASSPTSSVNQRKVASPPRSASRRWYVRRMACWNSPISIRS